MTMHIIFQEDKDGYKKDWSGYVERSLARRFCENGIAIPYQTHLDNIYEVELAAKEAKEAKEKKKAEKEKADQEKKAALLKAKEKKKVETATSKKPKKAEKSFFKK